MCVTPRGIPAELRAAVAPLPEVSLSCSRLSFLVLWLREAQLTLWHDRQGHRALRGVMSALCNGAYHGRADTSIPAA